MKLVSGGSLDPARANKATEETRNRVFYKLDCYVRNLYCQGKIPWKSYSEVPASRKYNMDEVGSDTTKHRAKIIACPTSTARLFCVTPEGDGKMNMHVSAAVVTRGDGKSQVDWWGVDPVEGSLVVV